MHLEPSESVIILKISLDEPDSNISLVSLSLYSLNATTLHIVSAGTAAASATAFSLSSGGSGCWFRWQIDLLPSSTCESTTAVINSRRHRVQHKRWEKQCTVWRSLL